MSTGDTVPTDHTLSYGSIWRIDVPPKSTNPAIQKPIEMRPLSFPCCLVRSRITIYTSTLFMRDLRKTPSHLSDQPSSSWAKFLEDVGIGERANRDLTLKQPSVTTLVSMAHGLTLPKLLLYTHFLRLSCELTHIRPSSFSSFSDLLYPICAWNGTRIVWKNPGSKVIEEMVMLCPLSGSFW